MPKEFDLVIVGAGIVGLATAYTALARSPGARVALLEKEVAAGRHQTGHNSGVIHSGAYYRPGSAKARLCLRGRDLLIAYLDAHGIPHRRTGKLIVASHSSELPALQTIRERAAANGVPGVAPLSSEEIRALEPEVRGVAGLTVPTAEIVDYKEVARSLAEEVVRRGGELRLSVSIRSIEKEDDGVRVRTDGDELRTRFLVNCAGLYSDRVARLAGVRPRVQIIPFRGEYFWIRSERNLNLSRLIYPVPNPALPFLGVHLTLTIGGKIEAGPNAVLAWAREGYTRSKVRWDEMVELATYPGFWAMTRKFWKVGVYEQYRSLSRDQYSRDLGRLVPSLTSKDLEPGGAGVRAQAVDGKGSLVDDFVYESAPGSLHVLNAPSPAATSSLAIAEDILRSIPESARC
jgi:(S)-2-hydroxyglutarate dehydrogenase